MRQKGLKEIIILASTLIVGMAFFLVMQKNTFTHKAQTSTNSPLPNLRTGVYKAKSFCGEFHSIRKIANNFQEALNIFRNEKTEQYRKYCPGNPCFNVELTTNKVQGLTDLSGNSTIHTLYLITIQDKSTKLPVQSVSDAIDDEGVLYDVPWCPD